MELFTIFLVMSLGYLIGRINFFGIKFGASAILIVALFFGHFGFEVPAFLSKIGLVLFLTPIGLMAGPDFVENIKKNGVSFLLISFIAAIVGGLTIIAAVKIFKLPVSLSLGLATGALTSTSMLGTVNELTDSILPGVGYGIAYVFGVVGVVLFVQIVPKILGADREVENAKLEIHSSKSSNKKIVDVSKLITIEKSGLFSVAIAAFLGILIGMIKIKAGSAKISLGSGGGSLIGGLILGHIGNIGRINLRANKGILSAIRDLGLAFFLLPSGLKAGSGFVEVVSQYGIKLFFVGVLMTLITTIVSFLLSYKVFKLPLFGALGATTGAMTSAPSLGALLTVTEDDRVSSFYAATQPTATIFLVFLPQIIALLIGID